MGGSAKDESGGIVVDNVFRGPYGRTASRDQRQAHTTFKDGNTHFKLQANIIDSADVAHATLYVTGTSEGEATFREVCTSSLEDKTGKSLMSIVGRREQVSRGNSKVLAPDARSVG